MMRLAILQKKISRPRPLTASLLATLVGMCACRAPAPEPTQVTVADSAGVKIVAFDPGTVELPEAEFVASRSGLAAGLDSLHVGRLAGAEAGLDAAGNPTLVVGDNGQMTVSVIDANGAVIARFGRRGDGPGEYRDLRVIGLSDAGQVAVNDPLRQRIAWADLAGKEIGSLSLPGRGWGTVIPVGSARDGSLFVATFTALPEPVARGTVRPTVHLQRIPPLGNGEPYDLGTFLGDAVVWKTGGPDGLAMGEAPYGEKLLLTVHDGTTTIAGADDDGLRVLSSEGTLRSIIRIEGGPPAVSPEAIAAFRAAVIPRAKGYEAEWAVLTSDDVFPATMPRVAALLTDSGGQRWMFLPAAKGDERSTAIVLGAGGTPVLRATMPASVRPLAFVGEFLVGVTTTSEGEERLKVLHLRRD